MQASELGDVSGSSEELCSRETSPMQLLSDLLPGPGLSLVQRRRARFEQAAWPGFQPQ